MAAALCVGLLPEVAAFRSDRCAQVAEEVGASSLDSLVDPKDKLAARAQWDAVVRSRVQDKKKAEIKAEAKKQAAEQDKKEIAKKKAEEELYAKVQEEKRAQHEADMAKKHEQDDANRLEAMKQKRKQEEKRLAIRKRDERIRAAEREANGPDPNDPAEKDAMKRQKKQEKALRLVKYESLQKRKRIALTREAAEKKSVQIQMSRQQAAGLDQRGSKVTLRTQPAKPEDTAPVGAAIRVRIVNDKDESTQLLVPQEARAHVLMTAAAARMGLDAKKATFRFKGKPLNADDTIEKNGLADLSVVNVAGR